MMMMMMMMRQLVLVVLITIISLVLLILVSVVPAAAVTTGGKIKLPPNVTVPALLVFGDSIVDAGNNNALINSLIKSDFPPYGKDFQGGIPTGRFCNGRIPSDFFADILGIKSLVPAYLDPSLKPHELLTGVTFASGGSGYDPLTPQLASVIPMSQQLEYLKEYIGKVKGLVGEGRTNFILANSIFIVVAGSDDIANTYFLLGARTNYDIPSYTDFMVNSASDFLKDLYNLGARRIGVYSAPPIGCVPSQRTLAGGLRRECSDKHNYAATLFNKKLSGRLNSMSKALPSSRLVYIDIYNPLMNLILHPESNGFEVVTEGCCGTGNIEVAVLCNKLLPTCPDDSKYVFWDSYHPTERAYDTLIQQLAPTYVHSFFP